MPLCVGHEVIGKAIKVGDKVSSIKVGQRVGVGAQISSCLQCKNCKSDNENYCPDMVGTCSVKGVLSRKRIANDGFRYLWCALARQWSHITGWIFEPHQSPRIFHIPHP